MKKNLFYSIIAVLLCSAAFCIGCVYTTQKYKKEVEGIINMYASDEYEDAMQMQEKIYDGLILDNNNMPISDTRGNEIDISTLGGSKSIIARFSATGCPPCINTLLESLQTFAEKNPTWHINLLIDNIALRDLFVMSKEYGPSFSLYSTTESAVDTGSSISPVVFRITPEGKIFRHFTCNPNYPEYTFNYAESISL